MADNISTDYSYLESQSRKIFTKLAKCSSDKKNVRIDLKLYSSQHPALKRMIIRSGIKQLKGNTNRITLTHLREIEDFLQNRPQKSTVHLPQNITIRKDSKYLILAQNWAPIIFPNQRAHPEEQSDEGSYGEILCPQVSQIIELSGWGVEKYKNTATPQLMLE